MKESKTAKTKQTKTKPQNPVLQSDKKLRCSYSETKTTTISSEAEFPWEMERRPIQGRLPR